MEEVQSEKEAIVNTYDFREHRIQWAETDGHIKNYLTEEKTSSGNVSRGKCALQETEK